MKCLQREKMAMDQLRKGLECLNVHSLLAKHTDMMRVYFVKCGDDHIPPDILTNKVFKNAKKEEVTEENERTRQFFLRSLTTFYRGEYKAKHLDDYHYHFHVHCMRPIYSVLWPCQ